MKIKSILIVFSVFTACCMLTSCEKGFLFWDSSLFPKGSISSDCVVTFFEKGGKKYLSEQKHLINPTNNIILITANEPEGKIGWKLNGSKFEYISQDRKIHSPSHNIYNRYTAKAVLSTFSIATGHIDIQSGSFLQPEKHYSQWYQPIDFKTNNDKWYNLTVYKNINSEEIDFIRIDDVQSDNYYIAKSYNFRILKNSEKYIPTKIDVLEGKRGQKIRQILQIKYHSIIKNN